jgi:hypothetical protein
MHLVGWDWRALGLHTPHNLNFGCLASDSEVMVVITCINQWGGVGLLDRRSIDLGEVLAPWGDGDED